MLNAQSVRILIVLLMVAGCGILSTAPSRAQMVEQAIRGGIVQQTIQSIEDKKRRASSSQTDDAKGTRPAAKRIQAAKKESKEDKKPKAAGQQQQAARNPSGVPPAGEQRYVPDEIVVELASSTSPQQINALTQRFRLATLETVDFRLGNSI